MAVADAWECHCMECNNCGETLLIRDPVKKGDSVKCPHCGKKTTIEVITAGYRSDKNKQTHDAIVVGW